MKEYNAVEIWDYKGSRFPDINKSAGKNKLRRYTFQMMVYAELYKLKYGKYPLKGIIYFMNELDIKPEPTIRPTQAVYEIDFRNPLNMRQIAAAMKDFSSTVGQIDKCKQTDRWEPPTEEPDKETCDICDTRWNCPTVKKKYPMRYP
jgi:putative RecB family exonuclease